MANQFSHLAGSPALRGSAWRSRRGRRRPETTSSTRSTRTPPTRIPARKRAASRRSRRRWTRRKPATPCWSAAASTTKASSSSAAGVMRSGAIRARQPQGLKWLTLEAYQDEHVVLDGAVAIPADKWELVNGPQEHLLDPVCDGPRTKAAAINMVFRDGTMIMPTLENVRRHELLADRRTRLLHRAGHAGRQRRPTKAIITTSSRRDSL